MIKFASKVRTIANCCQLCATYIVNPFGSFINKIINKGLSHEKIFNIYYCNDPLKKGRVSDEMLPRSVIRLMRLSRRGGSDAVSSPKFSR